MARSERKHAIFFHAGLDLCPRLRMPAVSIKVIGISSKFMRCIDCIAGRAGDRADDGAFFAQQAVEQAGFPGVWLADDGDLDRVRLQSLQTCWLGQLVTSGIQQIAGAGAMDSRDRVRFAHAQLVELQRLNRGGLRCRLY